MNIINDEADNEQEQRDWLKFRLRGEAIRRLQLERMRRLWLEEMRRLRLREVRKQLGPIFDRVAETKKIDKGCMMKTAGIRGEIDDFDNSDRAKKRLSSEERSTMTTTMTMIFQSSDHLNLRSR